MQLALVEFARNVAGMQDAHTTEVNQDTPYPVVHILPKQAELLKKKKVGASMRLGSYGASLVQGTKVDEIYQLNNRKSKDQKEFEELSEERQGLAKENVVVERHRHRYEVNPQYIQQLEEKGLTFSGFHKRSDDTTLMEFLELPQHPFFIATQAHPEFKSSLEDPAPLFYAFIKAAQWHNTSD